MAWYFWVMSGIAVGYAFCSIQKRSRIRKLKGLVDKSASINNDLLSIAEKAVEDLRQKEVSSLAFIEKSDQLFKDIGKVSESAINQLEALERQNGEVSENLKQLKIKHERLLAHLN